MRIPQVGGDVQKWFEWVENSTHEDWAEMTNQEYQEAYSRAALLCTNNEYDVHYSVVPGQGIQFQFPPRFAVVLEAIEDIAQQRHDAKPSVLDVGCGQGHLALELAQRGYEVGVTDVAISMRAIVDARRWLLQPEDRERFHVLTEFGFAHRVLLHADYGFAGPYDILVAQEMLEHLQDGMVEPTCKALRETARQAIIMTVPADEDPWGPHIQHWTPERFEEHFGRDGWTVETQRHGQFRLTVARR